MTDIELGKKIKIDDDTYEVIEHENKLALKIYDEEYKMNVIISFSDKPKEGAIDYLFELLEEEAMNQIRKAIEKNKRRGESPRIMFRYI